MWLCRAEVVARLDADDICLPGRLKKQWNFLDTHPGYAVVGGHQVVMEQGNQRLLQTLPVTHQQIAAMLPRENPLIHPAVCFRRQVILDLGGYDETFRYAQDYDLWFRVLAKARAYNLPDPVILRRVTPGMISEARGRAQLACAIRARLKNAPSSPDPAATIYHALRLGAKLPFYSPRIRQFYRKYIKRMLMSKDS